MMVRGFIASLIVLAIPAAGWLACLPNEPAFIPPPPSSDAGIDSGSEPDIDAGRCATGVEDGGAFGEIKLIFSTRSGADRRGASLSRNEKTVYFAHSRDVSSGAPYPAKIHVARRDNRGASFTESDELPAVNLFASQDFPHVSYDEKTLVFAATAAGGGASHLYLAIRNDGTSEFGPPRLLDLALDGGLLELTPSLRKQEDGFGDLWFAQCSRGSSNDCRTPDAGGNTDLYKAVIKNPDLDASSPFGVPEWLKDLNDGDENESSPVVSADGLEIFFARNGKIFRAWRTPANPRFANVEQVGELNESKNEAPNWLSPDNCRLYYQSQRESPGEPAIVDLYMATRKSASP